MQGVNETIEKIIEREGGFVNDPRDAGGATCWGITEAVARAEGYKGEISKLPKDLARKIYLRKYFYAPGFDAVHQINAIVADKLTDCGVNMGPKVAITFLQRALNVFNNEGKLYPEMKIDGILGNTTLGNLDKFLEYRKRDVSVLLKAVNALQAVRYIELAEGKQTNEAFVYGWLANRIQ